MDLTQEGPERDHWGKDAVSGLDTFLAYEIDNVLNRQHGTERTGTLLEEPAKQALYLCHSSTSDRMYHGKQLQGNLSRKDFVPIRGSTGHMPR